MKKNEKREYDCKLNFLKFGKKEFLRKNKKKKKKKNQSEKYRYKLLSGTDENYLSISLRDKRDYKIYKKIVYALILNFHAMHKYPLYSRCNSGEFIYKLTR